MKRKYPRLSLYETNAGELEYDFDEDLTESQKKQIKPEHSKKVIEATRYQWVSNTNHHASPKIEADSRETA